jgi:hypothetical protein
MFSYISNLIAAVLNGERARGVQGLSGWRSAR